MARGEEKDLKALWEVTEELWGVEGEMVFQNLSQSFSQTSKFFSIFHNLSKLPFKTCSVFTLSKLVFILSRLFTLSNLFSTFPNVGGMIWQRWRSGRAEEGWRYLQVRDSFLNRVGCVQFFSDAIFPTHMSRRF